MKINRNQPPHPVPKIVREASAGGGLGDGLRQDDLPLRRPVLLRLRLCERHVLLLPGARVLGPGDGVGQLRGQLGRRVFFLLLFLHF